MRTPHILNFFLLNLKSLFYLSLIIICQLVTNHLQACTKKIKIKIYPIFPTFRFALCLVGFIFKIYLDAVSILIIFKSNIKKLYNNHYYHDSLSVLHRQIEIVYFIAITNIMITLWHA